MAPEPGYCEIPYTRVEVPFGPGRADFFLVVPSAGGLEGSYGIDSTGAQRPSAGASCSPQAATDLCLTLIPNERNWRGPSSAARHY